MKKNTKLKLTPAGQARLVRLVRTRGMRTSIVIVQAARATVDSLVSGGFARPHVVARIEALLERMEAEHEQSVSRAS